MPSPSATVPAVAAAPTGPFAYRNLPLLLLRAREGVLARFRPILHAHGLTEPQWRIVRALVELGPLEPRQIGPLCGISSPSMAGILARMEALGLVQRERLAHDQRRLLVRPSARSRALAAQMAPQIDAAYAALQADLGAETLAALFGMLDAVLGRLGEAGSGPPGPQPDAEAGADADADADAGADTDTA